MMLTVPARAPATDGVKLILTEQVAPGVTLAPEAQVLLAIVKSVPVIDVAPNTKAAVPVLVRVTD